ncbi:MAG: Fic family protein [Alphaproteobacteria bacterium]|nr:Fic family protein [Alphaproteobacteria bacterium]
MAYIYEQKDWPEFRWSTVELSSLVANIRHKQGLLLGRMSVLGFQLRNEASLEILTTDVVKSSAIEGESLDPEQVRSSIAKRLGVDISGSAAINRHVEGIVEMMLDATQKYDEPLTKERLFGWHATLFPTGRSGMHKITVGDWRFPEAGAMQVVSGIIGRENVHFEAPDALLLEQEMDSFLNWFNNSESDDPVLKAAIAHFWFVTIHPFEDGNGRIARAIADMALARSDNSPQRFYSMSAHIEQVSKEYYNSLETCQKGDLDITLWLNWFLSCLERAIENADETLSSVLYKAKIWQKINLEPVNERQRKIINLLLGDFLGKLTTSKYAKLAKCSPDTALRDVQKLIKRNIMVQNLEGGRSTSYQLVDLNSINTEE